MCADFYVLLLPSAAAKRTLTLSQMNTSIALIPSAIAFYAKSRGLSGAAVRGEGARASNIRII